MVVRPGVRAFRPRQKMKSRRRGRTGYREKHESSRECEGADAVFKAREFDRTSRMLIVERLPREARGGNASREAHNAMRGDAGFRIRENESCDRVVESYGTIPSMTTVCRNYTFTVSPGNVCGSDA